jgi:hypothetical protein
LAMLLRVMESAMNKVHQSIWTKSEWYWF